MDTTILEQLIKTISDLSPMVWSILMKQVYIETRLNIVWSVILFFVLLASVILAIKFMKDSDPVGLVFGLLAITTGFAFSITVTTVYMYMYNPEFYAIKLLLSNGS